MSFYIRITEEDGYETTDAGPLTLYLHCGPNTITSITQSAFEIDQSFELLTTANPIFSFEQDYGNSVGCTNSYSVTDILAESNADFSGV
jgi:hypothetical protein